MAADPKLVVALEARLNKFEQDLQKAGVLAEGAVKNIEQKFERANPRLGRATFLGTFLGQLAGQLGAGVIRFLEELPEQFQAIARAADFAGVSIERALSIGSAAGNIDKTMESLERLATLLDRAQRGEENGLAKLFGANDIDVKNIKTVEQAWLVIADLVKNAKNPVQEAEVLRLAGVSQELAEHFRKGSEEVARLQREAQKAEPQLRQLANVGAELGRAWTQSIDNIKTFFLDMLRAVAERVAPISRAFADWMESMNMPLAGAAKQAAEAWERMSRLSITVRPRGDGSTNLPDISGGGGAESRDAFDRQEDQIRRRMALMDAETRTIGQSVPVRERARVEAELMNAATRAGIPDTEELRQKVAGLADEYARAAQRAEMARDIMSATREFGSALSDAFKSAVIEGQRLDEVLKNLINRLSSRAIDSLFNMAFNAIGSSVAGGINPLAGAFSFGGPRAAGGPVHPGNWYMVGENGPEPFVPSSSGHIIPNQVAARSAMNLVFSPSTSIDARGSNMSEAQIRSIMAVERRATLKQIKDVLPTWQARQASLGKA